METRRRILSPSSPIEIVTPNEEEETSTTETKKSFIKTYLCRCMKGSWKKRFFLLVGISWFLWKKERIASESFIQEFSPLHHNSSFSLLPSVPPTSVGQCHNLQYTSPNLKHKPIWIASYPGSGSEMVRDLVQTLTGGLVGGSVYIQRDPPFQDCLASQAATCKTHWPLLPIHSPLLDPKSYHDKAILLIRNPIHAFPSRLNHLWEVRAKVQAHTRQAPESAWNHWIQKNWKQQIKTYRQLIQTWTFNNNYNSTTTTTSFPYQVDLVLGYEDLTGHDTGAMAAQQLVRVLHQANARVVLNDEKQIACLWNHVVHERPKKKRSRHSYIPAFTRTQKERILNMIDTQLLSEPWNTNNKVHQDLIRLLKGYSKDIQQNTRILSN